MNVMGGGTRTAQLVAWHWFGASLKLQGPVPPKPALDRMLVELATACARLNVRPVGLETECWRRPVHIPPAVQNDLLARLAIDVEPGTMLRSLRCWYVWQHPDWFWSPRPFPETKTIEGAT